MSDNKKEINIIADKGKGLELDGKYSSEITEEDVKEKIEAQRLKVLRELEVLKELNNELDEDNQ